MAFKKAREDPSSRTGWEELTREVAIENVKTFLEGVNKTVYFIRYPKLALNSIFTLSLPTGNKNERGYALGLLSAPDALNYSYDIEDSTLTIKHTFIDPKLESFGLLLQNEWKRTPWGYVDGEMFDTSDKTNWPRHISFLPKSGQIVACTVGKLP